MLPILLILYGADEDTYGTDRYGVEETTGYGEDWYRIDTLLGADGDGNRYADLQGSSGGNAYGQKRPYGEGRRYGSVIDLSLSYKGAYQPAYS